MQVIKMDELDNISKLIEETGKSDGNDTVCGLRHRLSGTIKIGDSYIAIDRCCDDNGYKCNYMKRYEDTGDMLCTWRPEPLKPLIRRYK